MLKANKMRKKQRSRHVLARQNYSILCFGVLPVVYFLTRMANGVCVYLLYEIRGSARQYIGALCILSVKV